MKKYRGHRRIKIPLKHPILTAALIFGFLILILRSGGGGGSSSSTSIFRTALTQSWHVPFNRKDTIPWILWQTFTSKDAIPVTAQIFQETWQRKNPDTPVEFKFHNNAEADAFMKEHFSGDEVYNVYKSFPLNIMRADLWRYAILYFYGGIYADIDVDCWRPVKDWFEKMEPGMDVVCPWCSWEECKAVVGQEHEGAEFLAQWTIAGVRGHPVFKEAIQLVLNRALNGIDIQKDEFVHYYTGPELWTQAVAKTLHMPEKGSHIRPGYTAIEIIEYLKINPAAQQRAREVGLCLMSGTFFNGFNVDNKAASLMWLGLEEYPNWRLQKEWLLNNTKVA